jgi:hypothetical protein
MSEIDIDRINKEIEGQIKTYASKVELIDDETVLRVTIPDAVVLDLKFQMNWWLDFIGQSVFQWYGRTFYCCNVETTEDSHIWVCHLLELPDDPLLHVALRIDDGAVQQSSGR